MFDGPTFPIRYVLKPRLRNRNIWQILSPALTIKLDFGLEFIMASALIVELFRDDNKPG